MAAFPSQEHRPLKKPRLGNVGPDVYPQDPKQREDELSFTAVKNGFSYKCAIEDEFGTAKKEMFEISEEKLARCLKQILAKKTEANTFVDTGSAKKKQQLNTKDHFWHITPRNKNALEAWFRDLAGNKSLTSLAKKVPSCNKKEEIFSHLIEFQVPMSRAAWFIKMTSAYQVAISEARNRNRQKIDPSMDWAQSVCKFLKDQLLKIMEHYQGNTNTTSFLTAGNTNCVDIDAMIKNWNYVTQLARTLYEESLLDRQEFLTWLLDLLEKLKITDDGVLRRVMHLMLMYMSEFVQSQLLSRRLAHWCTKRIANMINEATASMTPRTQSPMVTNGANGTMTTTSNNQQPVPPNPIMALVSEYSGCPQHRTLLLNLCGIVQTITLRCPGALVWHNFGEGKSNSILCGSPLDLIPVPPSSLPMPQGLDNPVIRSHLKVKEYHIKMRSRASEVRWSSEKFQQSAAGFTISRVLNILEILDKHNFDRVESGSSLDTLYTKIFSATQSKDSNEAPLSDEPILNVLCEWAVSTQRTGEHRAVVVARLIEKRQTELAAEKMGESEMLDEDSLGSDVLGAGGTPPFQGLLMNFLDTKAPVLDHNPTVENKLAFANLVLLFCELIRYDVFSHDIYMCSLVSRGDLTGTPALVSSSSAAWNADLSSVKSETNKHDLQEDMKMEIDNPALDADFDMFPFKDETGKPSPDQPSSVKSERSAATPAQAHTPVQAHTPGMGHTTPVQAHTPGAAHTPGSHTPGAAHTPSGAHTPGMAHTPGIAHTPGMAYTPGVAHTPASVPPSSSQHHNDHSAPKRTSKHLTYATHFPVPQDEAYMHECNQRMIALYGVGKARDDARHITKKITKEIMKLFNKKNSIDVSSGDIGKKGKKRDKEKEKDEATSFEGIFNKFQKLSYYDQHAVTWSCSASVLDQVQNFAAPNSQHQHLPLIENVSYLFDLMEYAYNVNGLLDFVISLLKELSEVEQQLQNKSSNLAGSYSTQLGLCIVAVLRKYHAYLLVSQEQTMSAFEGLKLAVKHVAAPSDCSSAERCILAFLYDLNTVCCFIRAQASESFGPMLSKIKNALHAGIQPSSSNLLWEPYGMMELVDNPKSRPDAALVRQLNESSSNRYSFVCNVLLQISNCQNMDRLNEISILCAELTACCNALSSEWLGVLKALCWSANHSSGFIDVLTQVDVSDLSIHDSLAVFTGILIARHCFSLEDLVVHVALHSLLAACPSSPGDQDAEQGARLTCHLLLRLFCSSHTQLGPAPANKNSCNMKSSCDRHLLAAAHNNITVGAVVAVLKSILMLAPRNESGDSCNNEVKNRTSASTPPKDIILSLMDSLEDGLEDAVDMPPGLNLPRPAGNNKGGMESAGLSEYAKHALREICSQEWVRERFLKNPEELFKGDMLLDSMLKKKQAQQLVQMICYPGGLPSIPEPEEDEDEDEDGEPAEMLEQQRTITRILKNMDQWSMRVSWLELQLMIKQTTSSMNDLLDNIAKGTIEVFQPQSDSEKENGSNQPNWSVARPELSKEGVWLVAPLIAKLPTSVQGRVLKVAGQVLESGNNFWSAKTSKDKEKEFQKSIMLLGQQPFLSLILTCLRGQDEQREGLLNSLHNQLDKFISNAKESDKGLPEDGKILAMMFEALQLRLSLVGSMFDTIQRATQLTVDWSLLLMQLMSSGVVDSGSNSELFTTVLDMLSVLAHGTLVSENSERGEETKKSYLNLIKKLKTNLQKELGDKRSEGIDELRQLLPLPKRQVEVICVDRLSDSRHKGTNENDKRMGLQTASKVKIVAWDLLEGHKNPAPLSWVWFGAVRMEKKPLKYEEYHRLILYHKHSVVKLPYYYLEPPPLPAEELDPPPPKEEEKPPEPITPEAPKPESGTRKKKPNRRRARPTTNTTNYIPQQGHMGPMFPDQMYRPSPSSNWVYPNQPQQTQYYTQQVPPGGPRFGPQANPKQVLRGVLNARQPPYMPTNVGSYQHISRLPKYQQQHIIRQRLSMQHMSRMGEGGNMYPQAPPGPFQQHPQHMGMQQGMSQNYGGFNNMPPQQSEMMDTGNPGMMSGGQFQQPGAYQSSQPMQMSMPQQTSYMSQQQPQMQQHFPSTSQTTPPNPTNAQFQGAAQQPSTGPPQPPQRQFSNPGSAQSFSNISGGTLQPQMGPVQGQIGQMGSMSGYNQLGPQGPQAAQGPQTAYNMQHSQGMNQQRIQMQQRQLLAMQQQQQQQHQVQQQQHAPPQTQQQMVAQLQRQTSQPPQYGSYPQPPQYNQMQ